MENKVDETDAHNNQTPSATPSDQSISSFHESIDIDINENDIHQYNAQIPTQCNYCLELEKTQHTNIIINNLFMIWEYVESSLYQSKCQPNTTKKTQHTIFTARYLDRFWN